MLDEWINCSTIFADGLGIKTTGFAIRKVFLGSRRQRDSACAVWQNDRALRRSFPAEPLEFVERQPLLALPLRIQCIGASVDPLAVVAHVVTTFGMLF